MSGAYTDFKVTLLWMLTVNVSYLSINSFSQIARIGIVMMPDRHKTVRIVSYQYHDDTDLILPMIHDVLAIPNGTNQCYVC